MHKRHFDTAELLLHRHGAVVDALGHYRETPLQGVSANGLIDVARWLLDHGADANWQPFPDNTPLMLAAVNGHLELVRMLFGHGAGINGTGYAGT